MVVEKTKSPTLLMILDGFGINDKHYGNAIYHAKTPNLDKLFYSYPISKLIASGKKVGLPKGFQGSSEVGHLNIGAGRIVKQEQVLIDESIRKGEFFRNYTFLEAINKTIKNGSNLHIMGLLQDQGVHAKQEHLFALLKLCKKKKVIPLIHIISDGRDTLPKSAGHYIMDLQTKIKKYGGKIVSICGRYYAMDRDKRWDRTRIFYEMLVDGESEVKKKFKNPLAALHHAYKNKENDEFIKPRLLEGFEKLENNDSLIFYNYRGDRARQITKALIDPKFRNFNVNKKDICFVSMTRYYKEMDCLVAYERKQMKNILGEVISKKNLKQLRIAETEKYAHVTYFFNDEIEKPFKNEQRLLVDSPKVSTYDLKPEMSAYQITDNLLKEMYKYDFIVLNFANCDMVGHTGIFDAGIKAVEAVDDCVGRVIDRLLTLNGKALIIADHGNCEKMKEKDGSPNTAHTTNKVPCCLIGTKHRRISNGKLGDVAPTILKLMKIKKPAEMTGKSLV